MTDLIGFPTVIKKPGILDRVYEDVSQFNQSCFACMLNFPKKIFTSLPYHITLLLDRPLGLDIIIYYIKYSAL
jgi:hypothetical protein